MGLANCLFVFPSENDVMIKVVMFIHAIIFLACLQKTNILQHKLNLDWFY